MIELFFMTWLTCATYSSNLNAGADLQYESKAVQTSGAVGDDTVPYGPEPMCGGSKEAGDRWCY